MTTFAKLKNIIAFIEFHRQKTKILKVKDILVCRLPSLVTERVARGK